MYINIIICFTAKTYNKQNKNDGGENIQTTATPASGKTIIIDAGHGTQTKEHKAVQEQQRHKLI